MRLRRLTATVLVPAGLALAACGETSAPGQPTAAGQAASTVPAAGTAAPPASTTPPSPAPAAPAANSVLPDLVVDDVAGGKVNLASLTPSPTPLLVWFWAPH